MSVTIELIADVPSTRAVLQDGVWVAGDPATSARVLKTLNNIPTPPGYHPNPEWARAMYAAALIPSARVISPMPVEPLSTNEDGEAVYNPPEGTVF